MRKTIFVLLVVYFGFCSNAFATMYCVGNDYFVYTADDAITLIHLKASAKKYLSVAKVRYPEGLESYNMSFRKCDENELSLMGRISKYRMTSITQTPKYILSEYKYNIKNRRKLVLHGIKRLDQDPKRLFIFFGRNCPLLRDKSYHKTTKKLPALSKTHTYNFVEELERKLDKKSKSKPVNSVKNRVDDFTCVIKSYIVVKNVKDGKLAEKVMINTGELPLRAKDFRK